MSRMSILLRCLCCVLGAVGSVDAAELVVRDLIIDLEFMPAAYDYTLSDGNGTRH